MKGSAFCLRLSTNVGQDFKYYNKVPVVFWLISYSSHFPQLPSHDSESSLFMFPHTKGQVLLNIPVVSCLINHFFPPCSSLTKMPYSSGALRQLICDRLSSIFNFKSLRLMEPFERWNQWPTQPISAAFFQLFWLSQFLIAVIISMARGTIGLAHGMWGHGGGQPRL